MIRDRVRCRSASNVLSASANVDRAWATSASVNALPMSAPDLSNLRVFRYTSSFAWRAARRPLTASMSTSILRMAASRDSVIPSPITRPRTAVIRPMRPADVPDDEYHRSIPSALWCQPRTRLRGRCSTEWPQPATVSRSRHTAFPFGDRVASEGSPEGWSSSEAWGRVGTPVPDSDG